MTTQPSESLHIALYLENFSGGGVQVVTTRLANGFAERGHKVDLCVCDPQGPLRVTLQKGVNVVPLEPKSPAAARWGLLQAERMGSWPWLRPYLLNPEAPETFRYWQALASYLKEAPPDVLYAATPTMNVEASAALGWARTATRLIVSEHNDLSKDHPLTKSRLGRWLRPLCKRTYRNAFGVVAVSKGVASDIVRRTEISPEAITVVYPPAIPSNIAELAKAPANHSWFEFEDRPLILAVGRAGRAKDFETLVRAFAIVRHARAARLVVLGGTKKGKTKDKRRDALLDLAHELGIGDDIDFPGHVQNPYAFMARASVLAVSSVNEGFCMVLAEAMACGCPVVSTDCPSGPAEILDQGQYGPLVPVRDPQALSEAIIKMLDSPPDRHSLRTRSQLFTIERAVEAHLALFATG